ncbi:MAG TPA: hypothetical protein VKI44_16865 [Acetobacteraceae bacterium]|nr:hypothetical protein [Acetobacteraceae bacterium]
MRSNDQFNTTIYGYTDRFRGVRARASNRPCGRPHPTDQQRLDFIEGNLGSVWRTVIRKLEAGEAVTTVRFGSDIEEVLIELTDLDRGPRLSDARLTMTEKGGWVDASGRR